MKENKVIAVAGRNAAVLRLLIETFDVKSLLEGGLVFIDIPLVPENSQYFD